jgi:ribosomal-protein-alanine N-acetyltransferase
VGWGGSDNGECGESVESFCTLAEGLHPSPTLTASSTPSTPSASENPMKLTANRLYLRDFVLSDLDAVHEYASSIEVVQHQEWGPNTIAQTRRFITDCLRESSLPERGTISLAVVLNDECLIGACRATVSEDGEDAEIGYSLNPKYWRKGYGTEAAARLIEYLKNERKVQRIFATSRPENSASIHILEKLGMRPVDRYRKNVLIRGEWRDTIVFLMETE